jgi:LCP family protein required for cell wall assembly
MTELRPRSGRTDSLTLARHGQQPKSRAWPMILKIVGGALAVLLLSGAAVAGVVVTSLAAKIDTVDIGPTDEAIPEIGKIDGGFNILIVGNDTREGQDGIGGSVDDDGGTLNDVNILLHVSQDQTNAVAISFPRDMVVGIPECVRPDGTTKPYSTEPINVALSYGGLACAVMTVSELTGLPIQFAGMITFNGVITMADAIGGVPVCFTGPVDDPNTGLLIHQAGTYELTGIDALAFLRSRAGVGDGSDLTRISSQQVYLSALVRKLQGEGTLSDPAKVYNLADAALSNMQLSTSLGNIPTMTSIALALKDIPIDSITFVQYPGNTGGTGLYEGKVQPNTEAGDQLMAYVAADQPFTLSATGDGMGSTDDPNAPAPDASAPPAETGELPVLPPAITGQPASTYSCAVANDY